MFFVWYVCKMFKSLIAQIFPQRCLTCGSGHQVHLGLCEHCRSLIKALPEPICRICGKSIGSPGICLECQSSTPDFDRILSAGIFDGLLKDIIHKFKYSNATVYKKPLAGMIYKVIVTSGISADMITYVPLHWTRLISRGYNQAALIAGELSGYMGIDVRYEVIKKVRWTASQVGLKRSDRIRNLRSAFRSSGVRGKSVMVVDDVITTTQTARDVSKSLKKAGASRVIFVSAGRIVR
jgi:ComF family protein